MCYKTLSPYFFGYDNYIGLEKIKMKIIKFDTLDEAVECYGRENLIAIDCIKQIIFYTSHGCQPKFVFENECKPGKIAAWFLKCETNHIYKKWLENTPK